MPEIIKKKKQPRGGSRKGKPNRLTSSAKEAFLFAFNEMGGAVELTEWAKKNKTDFYKLFARIIPVDVTTNGKDIDGFKIIIGGKESE